MANAERFFQEGNNFSAQGRYKEAVKAFDQAILVDPNNPNLYINKAFALNQLGNPQAALDSFDTALQKDPLRIRNGLKGPLDQWSGESLETTLYMNILEQYGGRIDIEKALNRLEKFDKEYSSDMWAAKSAEKVMGNIIAKKLSEEKWKLNKGQDKWLERWLDMIENIEREKPVTFPQSAVWVNTAGNLFGLSITLKRIIESGNKEDVRKSFEVCKKALSLKAYKENKYDTIYHCIVPQLVMAVGKIQQMGESTLPSMLDTVDEGLEIYNLYSIHTSKVIHDWVPDWTGYVDNPRDRRTEYALPFLKYFNILSREWTKNPQQRGNIEYHFRRMIAYGQRFPQNDIHNAMGKMAEQILQDLQIERLINPPQTPQAPQLTEAQIRQIVNEQIAVNPIILHLQQVEGVQAEKLRVLMEAVAKTRVTQQLRRPTNLSEINKRIDQQVKVIGKNNPALKKPLEQFIKERVKNATDPERVFNALLAIIGGFVPGAAQAVAVIQALNILFSKKIAVENFQYRP